jgi:BolA family transcriptional regulator, general stress-responsive regulator
MTVADRIREKLEAALKPQRMAIHNDSHLHAGHHAGAHRGEETHFRLEVVSSAFAGQNRVARQRRIYALLAEELAGPVHALRLTLQTPEENQSSKIESGLHS